MTKTKFKNVFTREGLIETPSPSGDMIVEDCGWIYEDGELVYTVRSKTNLYEKIQAARDSVDLQAMLKRYEAGDNTVLDKVQGMYIDTVDLPKNYAELYTAVSRANEVFESMPVAIKEEYNNNPAAYWRAFGTEEFDKTLNAYRKSIYNSYNLSDNKPVQTVDKSVDNVSKDVKEGEMNE